MRILYITNGFPYPLTSGYLRHYHLIQGLATRHSVTLVSLVGKTFRPEHVEALRPYATQTLTFGDADARPARSWRGARLMRSVVSGTVADRPVRRMRAAVRAILRDDPPDVIVFSGKRTYRAIAGLRGVPVIADMCDATSVRILGRMQYAPLQMRPALWAKYLLMRDLEHRLVRETQHLMFASCRDREAILGPVAGGSSIVPNGIDVDYWRRRSSHLGRDTIVLTGAMDYAPNHDAALYLMEEILPRVRRSVPEVQALIVGRDAPERLVQSGLRHGALVTGSVPDVRPYLERASVFVAPIRFGAGIQNKLLEAMAMGVPVVTSPIGADGLRTEGGGQPPLSVASSSEEFVQQTLRALADTRQNPTPDGAGRQFVEQNFVWSKSVAQVDQLLASFGLRSVA